MVNHAACNDSPNQRIQGFYSAEVPASNGALETPTFRLLWCVRPEHGSAPVLRLRQDVSERSDGELLGGGHEGGVLLHERKMAVWGGDQPAADAGECGGKGMGCCAVRYEPGLAVLASSTCNCASFCNSFCRHSSNHRRRPSRNN